MVSCVFCFDSDNPEASGELGFDQVNLLNSLVIK